MTDTPTDDEAEARDVARQLFHGDDVEHDEPEPDEPDPKLGNFVAREGSNPTRPDPNFEQRRAVAELFGRPAI